MKLMKKQKNTLFIAIIIVIIVCIVVGMAFLGPSIIFFWCMITDDGGKLDNVDKISAVVTENQETLQDIVSQVLNPEQDLSFVINIEEQEFQELGSSRDEDEELFNLEDIYRLSEELYIQKIYAYKNSDVNMVIFQTNSSGLSVSGGCKGFLYLDQELTEDIAEYSYFHPYRSRDYSEITDNWYYYDIWY